MKALQLSEELTDFFDRLADADRRALLLDYDGTLAPFRVDRALALPYPGVIEALNEILSGGHTLLVVISGRAIADLVPLLGGIDPLPELWGSHGWERREANGVLRPIQLPEDVASGLESARQLALKGEFIDYCETKPAGIALHWRGLDVEAAGKLGKKVRRAWQPLVEKSENMKEGEPMRLSAQADPATPRLELHEFDGGIELRASGRDKGDAVRAVLEELGPNAAVAYAGDDRTDEDAFRALEGVGLGVLVRERLRPTLANVWLKPPDELIAFLTRWSHSCTKMQ